MGVGCLHFLEETDGQTEGRRTLEGRKRDQMSPGGAVGNRGPATQEYGILCECLGGHIWHSLVGPKLEARTKIGNLSVINQVLGTVGQLLQVLLFGILDWLLEIVL